MKGRQGNTILMVDDSPDDFWLVDVAFKRVGYPVNLLHVHSGDEAIAYLSGEGKFADREKFPFPKFIISDLKMPHGNGLDLLQALRQNPNWCTLPTVMLSGSGDADDVKKCTMLGATAYFTKRSALCEITHLMKTIFEFLEMAEHPARDTSGKLLPTASRGKLGEHLEKPRHFPPGPTPDGEGDDSD